MRVCGIIAEYDPFHLGHLHHIRKAREQSGADYVVAVLGCAFSQRGRPCCLQPMTGQNGAAVRRGPGVGHAGQLFLRPGQPLCGRRGGHPEQPGGGQPPELWLRAIGHPLFTANCRLAAPAKPAVYSKAEKALSAGHSFAKAQGMALAPACRKRLKRCSVCQTSSWGSAICWPSDAWTASSSPFPCPGRGTTMPRGRKRFPLPPRCAPPCARGPGLGWRLCIRAGDGCDQGCCRKGTAAFPPCPGFPADWATA